MYDNFHELSKLTTNLILGASNSIDIKGKWERHSEFGINIENLVDLADNRLKLRCIFPLPYENWVKGQRFINPSSVKYLQKLTERMREVGWQVRLEMDYAILTSSLIVDNRIVLFTEWLNYPYYTHVSEEIRDINHYSDQFEIYWQQSEDISKIKTLYEDLLYETTDEYKSTLAQFSTSFWNELISKIALNPELMRKLPPSKFEELIAELLSREGLKVKLTPKTHDGGKDILVYCNSPIGQHLYIVECKRYAENNPVGVSLVRSLYGVIEKDNATSGLLVTTSYFTKDAISFCDAIKYKIELKDYYSIVQWINRLVLK